MKVCLLYFELDEWDFWGDNLGPEFLAAMLRREGHEVRIMNIPVNISDELFDRIVLFNPGIIGFSLPCPFEKRFLHISNKLKLLIPKVHITCGNRYATDNSISLLKRCEWLDSVIRGEGEYTIVEMCRRIESGDGLNGCKGVYFRSDNKIITNEDRELIKDLDSIPFPDRDVLLELPRERNVTFITGRGCVNNCSFCNSSYTNRKNEKVWRGRSPQKVVDELEYISGTLGYKNFFFADPSYEEPGKMGKERIRKIAEDIIKRGLKINYGVYFSAHRWNDADIPLLMLLQRSGLEYVYVGIEAGTQKSLKLFNKKASVEDNCRMLELLRKVGIGVKFGFILFHPYLSLDELSGNVEFAHRTRIGYSFRCYSNQLEVYKGTEIYDLLEGDNLLTGEYDREIGNYLWNFCDAKVGLIKDLIFDMIKNDICIKREISLEYKMVSFMHRVLNNARSKGYLLNEALAFKKEIEKLYDEMNELNYKFMLKVIRLVDEGYDENAFSEYKTDLISGISSIVDELEKRLFAFGFKAKKSNLLDL